MEQPTKRHHHGDRRGRSIRRRARRSDPVLRAELLVIAEHHRALGPAELS